MSNLKFPMYYSFSLEEEKFNLYILFLKSLLSGDDNYKKLVDSVILEAKLLASNEKDYFTIDRNYYPIIVYLEKTDSEYFKNIGENIDNNIYEHVLQLLDQQRISSFA